MRTNVEGTVYLLHLERPLAHAQHYLGWTERDLSGRLRYHLNGRGSRFIAAAVGAGIRVAVARTWPGTRHLERKLKNRKGAPRLCPVCRGEILDPKWEV